MPLHLQSITTNDQNSHMLAWLLREGIEECESAFVSPEKYIHTQKQINDTHTGNEIGKLVYTLKVDDEKQSVFLLDLDIVLNNNATTSLRFINLLEGSSDSNEYYEVETLDEAHLEIETVNRHTKNCTLLGKKHDVRISAFPYELSVFSNILALNKYLGFSPIELNNTGILVGGLSNRFIMPGGIMDKSKNPDEHYSFLIGSVKSYSDVSWEFGEFKLDFVVATLDTALGNIPVAMSRDVFDLSALSVDSVIAMKADIKVDLSNAEDFTSREPD